MKFICTVDVVLLTLKDSKLKVALLRRDHEPFEGTLGLPGGYVLPEEDSSARDAAARMLLAKTGIRSPYLEQLATFSGPTRDPRGWSVSIAYYALVPAEIIEAAGSKDVRLVSADRPGPMPFDHADIVKTALERVRNKSNYSSLPVYLLGERFTKGALQQVYEAVLGYPLNKAQFRRKLDEMDMLEPVPGEMEGGQHRPAQLYRLKNQLHGSLSLLDRGL